MADYSAIADKLMKTWPARMAQDMWSAAKAPGNAYNSTPDNPVTTEQMIKPAADLAGGIMGTSFAAAPALRNASGMGIRAYHGSPHDFNVFDASKIGTGEGAQAYGHGLYFAENEGVAKAYRDQLSRPLLKSTSGELFNPSDLEHLNVRVAAYNGRENLDAPIIKARSILVGDAPQATKDMAARDLSRLEALKEQGGVVSHPGSMYEVNINADPNHFLDWDKPLAAQAGYINDKLKNVFDQSLAGREAYQSLIKDRPTAGGGMSGAGIQLGATPEAASGRFNATGIPGIKYLDQGSRASGDGSRNYVVFDPKIVDIMKKYGILGGALGGGASSQSGGILGTPQGNM